MQLLRIILFPMCIFVYIWVFILCFYVKWIAYCGSRSKVWKPLIKNSSHLCTAYHLSVTLQKHSDCINGINFSVIFYDSGSSWIKDDIGDKCLVWSHSRQGTVTEFKSRKSGSVGCALGGYSNASDKAGGRSRAWDQPPDSQYYRSLFQFTVTSLVSQSPILG